MRKMILLGACAILSLTIGRAAPVSIDTKTELAGIRLGQNTTEIDPGMKVINKYDRFEWFGLESSELIDRTPNLKVIKLKPKPGTMYGGLLVREVTIQAFYDVIYNVDIGLGEETKTNLERAALAEKIGIITEGFTIKYGPPSYVGQTGSHDSSPGFSAPRWNGKDISLYVDPGYSSISLISNKLVSEAKETFLKKNNEVRQHRKAEAEKILNSL